MVNRVLVYTFFAVFLLSACVAGIPAKPGVFELTQPDGVVFRARLRGDEHAAWYETSRGYSIVQDDGNVWVLARENAGKLEATSVRADAASPMILGSFPKHQRPARWALLGDSPVKGASPRSSGGVRSYANGTAKVLVLLMNFTDNPRVNAGKYIGEYYWNLYFNMSNSSSMASYYTENSYGKFNISGVVGGPNKWYSSDYTMSFWGRDASSAGDDAYYGSASYTYNLLCEALAKADADVNYANYDLDSDGFIDALAVVHAGCGQEDGSGCLMTDPLWSVRWSWHSNLCSTTFDGKGLKSGTVVAEDSPMGVAGHEAGHDLADLPDLYDTDYSSEGIGDWGMMAGGSWNGKTGYAGTSPSHFGAWSKYFMGWVEPTLVTSPLFDEQLDYVEANPDVYQIMIPLSDTPVHPSSGGEKEYFLVENRQKTGFDTYIPGSGVLIWHIDDNQARIGDNTFNKYDADRGVDLEEADGRTDLDTGANRGDSTDPWYSGNSAPLYGRAFNDSSTPNSKAKAGSATYINITNISASGSFMTVDFLGYGTAPTGSSLILSYPSVSPSSGYGDTTFNYSVNYLSANNSAPAYVKVTVDGTSFDMNASNTSDTAYNDGKDYFYEKILALGLTHNYSFQASDGINSNSTSTSQGPNVTAMPGYLTVTLLAPNLGANLSRNEISNVTAEVSCVGGACGDVTATLNHSSGMVQEDSGTPFYSLDPNPMYPANLSCLQSLAGNTSCNVTWRVNATGAHDLSETLVASATTSSSSNDSVSVTIFSYTPSISNPNPENNTRFPPYTTGFRLQIQTHLQSVCRLANTTGKAFANMTDAFNLTNSTNHTINITGLSNNQSLDFYVRCQSSEGYANTQDYHLHYNVLAPEVVLNEITPSLDLVELYNKGESSVNLSLWIIEFTNDTGTVNISLSSVIDDFLSVAAFGLKDSVGDVNLYDRNGSLVDNASYGNLTANTSFGRDVDGDGNWINQSPTQGYTNEGVYSFEWPMFRHNPARTGTSIRRIVTDDLKLYWNVTIGDRVRSSPAVTEDIVYSASLNGSLYALNQSNGQVIWNNTIAGASISSSPAVVDDRIYVGALYAFSGEIYCFNASTGAFLWNRSFTDRVISSPTASNDLVYVGSYDKRMYALNASSGGLKWSYLTGDEVQSSPTISGGIVYFGSNDKKLYALNATTGSHIFNYTSGGKIYSTPAVYEGRLVFGSYDNKVYAINISSGTQLWNFSTSGGIWSSPALAEGVVYIGSNDRKVYAINLTSGEHIWNHTTGDDVESCPAYAGNRVYVGSRDERIRSIYSGNGSLAWSEALGGDIISSPAISSGMLFIGADDGKLYAYGIVNDSVAPNVTLLGPANASEDIDGNVSLTFQVYDEGSDSDVANCSLSIDGLFNQTTVSPAESVNISFDFYDMVNGSHNWSVSCVDDSVNLNVGTSETWFFTVSIKTGIEFVKSLISGWNLISLPVDIQ